MGSCFIAGTQVRLATGDNISIEDVEIGDILLGSSGGNKVLAFDHPKLDGRDLYSFNGCTPWVTAEHPFLACSGRWESIHPDDTREEWHDFDGDTLAEGSWLAHEYGPQFIDDLESHEADPKTQLYNFMLSGDQTYYADGFLVHNKSGDFAVEQRRKRGLRIPGVPEKEKFIPGTEIVSSGNPITDAATVQVHQLNQAIPLFDPYMESGQRSLERVEQGSTVEGLDQIIAQILSGDSFQSLIGDRTRAVEGQLSAGGLTRSGQAIEDAADIPTDLAFAIEQMLSGRQGSLATGGFAATSQIGDLTTQIGEAIASGILGNEASRNADKTRSNNKTGAFLGALGSIAGGLFSDPGLKENVRQKGKIGPLDLVKWDWTEDAQKTIAGSCPSVGFMSTQVKEFYPDCVGEYGGFDMVDYPKLIAELAKCH